MRWIPLFCLIAAGVADQIACGQVATSVKAAPPVAVSPATAVAASANDEKRPQFWFGVAVENIPPVISRQLKLKPDQGLLVTAVLADSPARAAGLRPDDLLVEINGTPLTSQEELARAANDLGEVKISTARADSSLLQPSTIKYLREGNPFIAQMTPAIRPADMLVIGPRTENFTPGIENPGRVPSDVRNIVLPNGRTAFIGPGYHFDLQGGSSSVKIIQQALSNGQSVWMSQETDDAGNVKNTIRVGGNTYTVEPGSLDKLPPSVRPLAEQMLAKTVPQPAQPARPQGVRGGPATRPSIDQRLNELAAQNEQLRQQLDELKQLLLKQNSTAKQEQ